MNNSSYPEEQIKTIRQERSNILADLAHLDTDAALFVLISALNERAGISIGWLAQYAALAGYDVTITEFSPFVAGSRAGDALTNEAWLYAFTVHAAGEIARRFRAGRSTAGEPLADWGEGPLECIINKYKPAHAVALFAYAGDATPARGYYAPHRHIDRNR